MTDKNRSHGLFGARRNYWIIGILVVIIGLIFVVVGYNMIEYGEKAKSKYETTAGKIIRILSPEEQEDYEAAEDAIVMGENLEYLGIFIIFIGGAIIIKPEFLFYRGR